MTDPERPDAFEAANADYLSAALAWIRAVLERAVPAEPVSSPGRRSRWGPVGTGRPALPRTDPDGLRARLDDAASVDPTPGAVDLFELFDLSEYERGVLLLCAAVELDSGIATLVARVQGDSRLRRPTVALAMSVLPDPAWDAISPIGSLRSWRLVEIDDTDEPFTSRRLRIDERVLNHIKGLRHLDDRLLVSSGPPARAPHEPLPRSQVAVRDRIVASLRTAAGHGELPVVQLVGPPETARVVAGAAADELGLELVRVAADRLPPSGPELSELARLWNRELQLSPVAVLIDGVEDVAEPDRAVVASLLDQLTGPVLVAAPEPVRAAGAWVLAVDVARPTPEEQAEAWEAMAGVSGDEAGELAGHFDLELDDIRHVAITASTDGGGDDGFPVWEACRVTARHGLDHLAQRIDARAGWDDLVLPRREIELLQLIASQARNRMTVYGDWGFGERMNRGLGVAALFTGGSGTGKTMAAEVLANHLRLDLYRIDVAAVISKWIGETAKNLRRLFDAAERSGAVLFFDEADALFAKRTEIRDSHDRYANADTGDLLTRLEGYRGVAILATNKRSAVDQAFLRRLRVVITFPAPGVDERRRLWAGALPAAVPNDGNDPVDIERLARYELSGGAIHSAALTGSFLAAGDGGSVGMRHLVAGARNELLKHERPIDDMGAAVT